MSEVDLSKEKEWLEECGLKMDIVSVFAVFWCIYEREIWNRYHESLKYDKLENFGIKLEEKGINLEESLTSLKDEFNYFLNKYITSSEENLKEFFNNKISDQDLEKFREYLTDIKIGNKKNEVDKISFLDIVIFRYRNNIFHGNKIPIEWEKYEKDISYCIKIMYIFLKQNKNKK